MRFVFKALIATGTAVSAVAGAVSVVNHTTFGKKHAPKFVKNTSSKTESAAKTAAKKTKSAYETVAGSVVNLFKRSKKKVVKNSKPKTVAGVFTKAA